MSLSVLTFATEDKPRLGLYSIQWQFPNLMINCIATNLEFTQKAIDLINETRANSAFRDIHLGNGRYQLMDPKEVNLSSYFADLNFSIFKCGKCDHGYYLHFRSVSDFWVRFHIENKELDDFLYGLKEIIEDYIE